MKVEDIRQLGITLNSEWSSCGHPKVLILYPLPFLLLGISPRTCNLLPTPIPLTGTGQCRFLFFLLPTFLALEIPHWRKYMSVYKNYGSAKVYIMDNMSRCKSGGERLNAFRTMGLSAGVCLWVLKLVQNSVNICKIYTSHTNQSILYSHT